MRIIKGFLKMITIIVDYIKNNKNKEPILWRIYFEEPYSTIVLKKFKAFKLKTSNIKEIHYCASNIKDTYYIKLFFINDGIETDSLYGFLDNQSYQDMENELFVTQEINKMVSIATKNNISVSLTPELYN